MATEDQKSMVAVVLFKVTPGNENAFKKAAADTAIATRNEDGCLAVTFSQSPKDATEFSAVELWRSQADIDRHAASQHLKKFGEVAGKMFAHAPTVTIHQIFDR